MESIRGFPQNSHQLSSQRKLVSSKCKLSKAKVTYFVWSCAIASINPLFSETALCQEMLQGGDLLVPFRGLLGTVDAAQLTWHVFGRDWWALEGESLSEPEIPGKFTAQCGSSLPKKHCKKEAAVSSKQIHFQH